MSYTNAFDLESTTTWINRQHNNNETKEGPPEDTGFGSHLPIPTSNTITDTDRVPSRKSQAPLPCQPSSSRQVLGSTSSHIPGEHCNSMLYHSMTASPMMLPQQLNQGPAKKYMTPLHVITSMSNDHFPFYSYPQGDSNKGGGLLKIASEVKSTGVVVPPASSSKVYMQSHGNVSESRYQCRNTTETLASFSGVSRPTWRPICQQPTMAVAPITSIGDDRMITKRPAPPESNLPLLKKRRLRTTFSKEQVDSMERFFKMSMYLNIIDRKELAGQLGLAETQVKTWFQNRRMRWKRQRPEENFTTTSKTVRAMKSLQCPPAATQGQFIVSAPPLSNVSTPPAVSVVGMPRQFVVPTPPPSTLTTPPAVAGTGQSEGLSWYPMLAPSTIYSQTPTPTVPTESCCQTQAVYGTPVFPHFPAGLGIHPWTSTNTIGPHGGVQYPPRHV